MPTTSRPQESVFVKLVVLRRNSSQPGKDFSASSWKRTHPACERQRLWARWKRALPGTTSWYYAVNSCFPYKIFCGSPLECASLLSLLALKGDGTFPSAPKRQQAAALQRAQWV